MHGHDASLPTGSDGPTIHGSTLAEIVADRDRLRDELAAAQQLAHDRAVLWDMAIAERDGRDHVIASVSAELAAVSKERDAWSASSANYMRQAQALTAERDQLGVELALTVAAKDELADAWGIVSRSADRRQERIEELERKLLAERELAPQIIKGDADNVRAETTEQIAAFILSAEVANLAGVDLTDPDCPRGEALTIAASAIRIWRKP
jgi:hypothetical protein